MLTIHVSEHEFFDHEKGMFLYRSPFVAKLEHSLISVAKWEAKTEKPFLIPSDRPGGLRSRAEELYYIECMSLSELPHYGAEVLLDFHGQEITDYTQLKYSATTIHRRVEPKPTKQTLTAELIYYRMFSYGIPIVCERWHLNRLLMLLQVFSVLLESKEKGSKMNARDSAAYMHSLNLARRASMNQNQ